MTRLHTKRSVGFALAGRQILLLLLASFTLFAGSAWGQAATSTVLTSSVNPAFVTQNTVLKATVTGSSPTGNVAFKDGTTTIANASVSAGVATVTVSFAAAGSHTLTAVYAGDTANATSTSAALAQTVNPPGATTTAFDSSTVNPTFVTQSTVLKAIVTGSSPTGTVTFKDGTTAIAYASVNASTGVASTTVSFSTAGTHTLSAVYGGDIANATSTSGTFTQTVNAPGATTTAFDSSTVNPTFVTQSTVLKAIVTGSSPTGTVTFKDGTTAIAYASVNASTGVASATVSFSTAGTHTLSAVYGGDIANATSTSGTFAQTVNAPGVTTTTFNSSTVNPTFVTQSTVLKATVTGSSPTGTVTFKDGTTAIAYASVNASTGVASTTVSFSTAGTHTLTATYGGDIANATSASGSFTQTVNAPGATTTTFDSSTVNPTFVTQSTVLKAIVTGSSPTGTVTFKDGTTAIAYASVNASTGVASTTVSFSTAGTHALTAAYGGDIANATSTSGAFTQTVNAPGATTTAITSSLNPAIATQNTTLTATVTGSTPTGNVAFKDGTTTIANASVNSAGVATATVSFSTVGTHSLTAVYAGDIGNATSTSAALTQTVTAPAATTTVLTSSLNPTVATQSTTLKATVTGSSPTGSVTFKDGTTTLGSASVSAGVASLTTSFSTTGSHSLTAVYGGDTLNATSTSAAVVQNVNAQGVTTTTTLSSSVNPVFTSQSTTLTATVTGSGPTGTVTFKDGATSLGSATVSGGVATLTTSFSTAGTHSLTAVYGGDIGNTTSTSAAVSETVNARTASSTALAASANPAFLNQNITLTATVTGSVPSGSVTFKDGGTAIGTASVSAGTATLVTTFTTLGAHSLTAVYGGDAPNTGSTSATLTQNVLPGNLTWVFGYDANGNRTTVTNPLGNVTSNTYDYLQRPTRVVQPPPVPAAATPTVNIGYDGQDNVTSVQDPRNLTTSYSLDGLANTTSQSSPDSGSTNATYDAAGNLLTKTDARGKTTTYTYDVLNRVQTIGYQTGTGTVYEYDGGAAPYPGSIGQLTKMTDESGVTTFGFDALGHPTSRSQLIGAKSLTTTYAWGTTGTATNKLTSITYPSGARVNYSYDTAGRVMGLTVNPPNANGVGTNTGAYLNILSGITYNADNNILGWTWANNAPYQRTYDSFGRLSSFPIGYPQGTGIAAGLIRTPGYDNAGRITGYSHSNLSGAQATFDQGFGYDALDRLVQQSTGASTYGYAYDATGNRTSLTVGGNTYANTLSSTSNRLTVVQTAGAGGAPVSNSQTYTNSGSLTADGTVTYAYSDRGRMSSSTVGNQTTAYLYNGLEQRVSKTGALVPTGAAYYAYDEGGQMIGEYDANLVPVAETVYIGSIPVVVLKETGTAAASTIQISVGNVYADQINTPKIITRNSDEAILWRWDTTEAFGSLPPQENPAGLGTYKYNQRMPGQVYDQETQNFYNLNRDYQAATGRYVQSDPIGLGGGINTYAYGLNQPTRYTDPSGLIVPLVIPGLCAAGGCEALIAGGLILMTPQARQAVERALSESRDHCCFDYKNVYEGNPKHGAVPRQGTRGGISPEPVNGQAVLATSVPAGTARIGHDPATGQVVIFRNHRVDEQNCVKYWHGYVVSQQDLRPEQWRAGRDADFPNWPRKP